jgi:hypothetical protein
VIYGHEKKKAHDELPPRDQTPLKYGMTDPGRQMDPKRIEDMQARVFYGAARAVPETEAA